MSRHLQNELEHLKQDLLILSSEVEDQVQQAIEGVIKRDPNTCTSVILKDEEIDFKEVELEETCLKILALHQPVAIDLRFVVASMKINNDLERIGDLSANIAQIGIRVEKGPRIETPFDLKALAMKVRSMLRRSLDSLMRMEVDLAHEVCRDDQEVDEIHRKSYGIVYELVKRDPKNVETYIHYLTISRHLERIADYTTNIAEDVIYMIDGTIIRHRPDLGSH